MRRSTILMLGVVPAVFCGVAISRLFGADARPEPLQEMERMRPTRAFAARISIPTTYADCTPEADSVATVPREACVEPNEGSLPLRELADAGQSTDPDLLRASGLAAMIWPDKKNDQAYGDAIARLEKALLLSPDRVPLLIDLSAAHLVRAEREQQPYDLVRAINYADQAVALAPDNEIARWNAALAKQAYGLDDEAALAWDAYRAIDSRSKWADEARLRKEQLVTDAPDFPTPAPGASLAQVDAFAAQWPQQAREYGFIRVLGDWGAAVAGGDSAACAESLLALAGQLGRALSRRTGGDLSLNDAVEAIRAVRSDPVATMSLARAHRAYAAGEIHLSKLEAQAASAAFDRVRRARPASPVLLQWTTLYHAAARYYSGDTHGRETDLRRLLATVNRARHPGLEGRGRIMLGAMLLHAGKPEREQLTIAMDHFWRAGETEHVGAALSLRGETECVESDTVEAYASLYRAQQTLRLFRASNFLHKNLHGLARCALLDGLSHAALTILNEDLGVVEREGIPARMGDALQARVEARTIIGDSLGATRDRDSVLALVARFPNEKLLQNWARAVIPVIERREVSLAVMDTAVASASQNVIWQVRALIRSADLRIQKGDLSGAITDLQTVTGRVQGLSSGPSDVLLRAAALEQARDRFDRLVMLHLRMGRPADALRALERGRLSFGSPHDGAVPAGDYPLTAPDGSTALEYSLIDNTLLTWTIRGDTIRFFGQPVDRDEFMLTVEQVNAALESHAPGGAETPGLQRLYDWLIRPVRGYLGPVDSTLVIVADGEIAGVPFAALVDSTTDRPLVRDYPIRYDATLADAAHPASGRGRTGPALLVADPRFDPLRNPGLYRLDSARAEIRELRGLYPSPVVLEEATATRDAFMESLRRASVVHYAGHAVFNDARPERSYLLLAGPDTTGRLTAEALSQMRLPGVRLVVLSACQTLRSREGRSGGFSGFSGALLSAGAGGVVGSLWQVNDQLTRELMVVFHQEYLLSGNPARALRKAQLRMLDSKEEDRRLNSPAAWAGFRYTGAERP